jgi:Rhodopirellula transposase DDE domain
LLDDLNALVEPEARGDPMSPLRWTCRSLRRLAAELDKLGHKISHTVVGELLKKQKFSLQANSKTREGADNPDRDAQFHVINDAVTAMAENQPAISVDRRRNWSATSRTLTANGASPAIRKKSGCTIS